MWIIHLWHRQEHLLTVVHRTTDLKKFAKFAIKNLQRHFTIKKDSIIRVFLWICGMFQPCFITEDLLLDRYESEKNVMTIVSKWLSPSLYSPKKYSMFSTLYNIREVVAKISYTSSVVFNILKSSVQKFDKKSKNEVHFPKNALLQSTL